VPVSVAAAASGVQHARQLQHLQEEQEEEEEEEEAALRMACAIKSVSCVKW
jgi:hypothetical protein